MYPARYAVVMNGEPTSATVMFSYPGVSISDSGYVTSVRKPTWNGVKKSAFNTDRPLTE
jgi:hypothetical protein